jgi:hypothetical protein
MRGRWLPRLRIVRADGSTADCIERGAGVAFGLGCTVCAAAAKAGVIRQSRWVTFCYGAEPSTSTWKKIASIQLEDLLRHCNLSQAQQRGKVPYDRGHAIALEYTKSKHECEKGAGATAQTLEDVEDMAPTNDQIRIALEICWGWSK